LIIGDRDTVEIVEFKSEKKPDLQTDLESMKRYGRQLEVYAHLVEKRIGKQVSKMHLYYTGENTGDPIVTFEKSKKSIDVVVKTFDEIVEKIQNREFGTEAKDKKTCLNCDMRYYCQKVKRSY
jgi:DNA helicase-2/ATP-dependent DNA helicase PcrA